MRGKTVINEDTIWINLFGDWKSVLLASHCSILSRELSYTVSMKSDLHSCHSLPRSASPSPCAEDDQSPSSERANLSSSGNMKDFSIGPGWKPLPRLGRGFGALTWDVATELLGVDEWRGFFPMPGIRSPGALVPRHECTVGAGILAIKHLSAMGLANPA